MRAGFRFKGWRVISAVAIATTAHGAYALETDFTGFATVAAGRSFGACQPNTMSTRFADACTRYVADWSHAGVYTEDWSASQESRVGLQWDTKLTPDLSGVVQLTGRLSPGQKASVEWAYLSYAGVKGWTFQLGRKRVPLYYYSDFQDIGYAYNTIRPAPDVYGWDVVNYNGGSARYMTQLGEWSIRQDFFAGNESSKNTPYAKLFYDAVKTIKWKNLVGASTELNYDWFTTRLTYAQSKYEQMDKATGLPDAQPSGATEGKQKFYGIAFNADLESWIIRSEFDVADRAEFAYKGRFYLMNLGYRLGKFIPTIGVSGYRESTPFPDHYAPLKNRTTSAVLRYELTNKSDIKVQFDRASESSDTTVVGSSKAIAISYDVVF